MRERARRVASEVGTEQEGAQLHSKASERPGGKEGRRAQEDEEDL